MEFLYRYLLSLWNMWFGLAGGLLTLNEISNKFFTRSWEWPVVYRAKAVVLLLVLAQVGAYKELFDDSATRLAESASVASKQQVASPVVAENPDHANFVVELKAAQAQREDWERRYSQERADKEKAGTRLIEFAERIRALEAGRDERSRRHAVVNQLGILHASSEQLATRNPFT